MAYTDSNDHLYETYTDAYPNHSVTNRSYYHNAPQQKVPSYLAAVTTNNFYNNNAFQNALSSYPNSPATNNFHANNVLPNKASPHTKPFVRQNLANNSSQNIATVSAGQLTPDSLKPAGGSVKEIYICQGGDSEHPVGTKGFQLLDASGNIVGGGYYGADGSITEVTKNTAHPYDNPAPGTSKVWVSTDSSKKYDHGTLLSETLFDSNSQPTTRTQFNANGSIKSTENWINGSWSPINPGPTPPNPISDQLTPDSLKPAGGSVKEIYICQGTDPEHPVGTKGFQLLDASGNIVGGGYYGADGSITEVTKNTAHPYDNPAPGTSKVWISTDSSKKYDHGKLLSETLFDSNSQPTTRKQFNADGSIKSTEKWINGNWLPVNPDPTPPGPLPDPTPPGPLPDPNGKTGGLAINTYNTLINSLNDQSIKSAIVNMANSGEQFLSYKSMSTLLQSIKTTLGNGNLSANQFKDLKTFVASLESISSTNSYVYSITNALINGDPRNAQWTGGGTNSATLGNLAAGSAASQFNLLINKWFAGTDNPSGSSNYATNSDPLFVDGVQTTDIRQGTIGDCYALAALVAVAKENPDLIKSMIIDNKNGTYGVRFYDDAGKPTWITVDNKFGSAGTVETGELWVKVWEKAYVEFRATPTDRGNNNYDRISGGWDEGLKAITGERTESFGTGNYANAAAWGNAITQKVINALNKHEEVMYASYQDTSNQSTGVRELYSPHMYAVVGWNASTNKFILRNPWGGQADDTRGGYDPEFELSADQLYGGGNTAGGYLFIAQGGPTSNSALMGLANPNGGLNPHSLLTGLANPNSVKNYANNTVTDLVNLNGGIDAKPNMQPMGFANPTAVRNNLNCCIQPKTEVPSLSASTCCNAMSFSTFDLKQTGLIAPSFSTFGSLGSGMAAQGSLLGSLR